LDTTPYDILPDAVIVVDTRGLIVSANVQCETLLGYRSVELAGVPVSTLVPERFEQHDAHVGEYMEQPSARLMGAGRYLYARTKTGTEIPVDIALSPVPLGDGHRGALAVLRDARFRADAEERLRIQAVALEAAANGVVITDTRGVITWANQAVAQMTGYTLDELIGVNSSILKSGVHDDGFYRGLWQRITNGEIWEGEIINRRKDGRLYHEEQTIAPVPDPDGNISHFIAIKLDVTVRKTTEAALQAAHAKLERQFEEIQALTKKLEEQAIRDPLTNLFNRRYLDEALGREMSRAIRQGEPLSAVMLDVDHFKLVNDHFGHEVGDQFLVALGELLRTQVRATDIACRFGGEEFIVIMPGADPQIAVQRAESWRKAFSEIVIDAGGRIPRCSLSGGVAAWNGPDEPAKSLLKRADDAMYSAKNNGRDRIVLAD
jgi:diguanylate cyclase (GGDEF)-like protein/PAS domain S-box-containing protein